MILLLAATAFADQCAWNTKAIASAGLEHLPAGAEWVSFCEPCNDSKPELSTVSYSEMKNVSDDYWEVSVNGKGVDLAYTFVKVSPSDTWFTNVAKLVGCSSSGVSRKVMLEGAPKSQAARLAGWRGIYEANNARVRVSQYYNDPNGLLIEIEYPIEHGSKAPAMQLSSYADVNGDPVTFKTAVGTCAVALAKTNKGLHLTPQNCSGLNEVFQGDFERL